MASGGNAGLANAYAAAQVGVPAPSCPGDRPRHEGQEAPGSGATVIQRGAEYAVAYDAAIAYAAETGALYCHAYDQPEIAAGAGTVGPELLEQLGGVDTVLVAVGGGGLMAGIGPPSKAWPMWWAWSRPPHPRFMPPSKREPRLTWRSPGSRRTPWERGGRTDRL